jgi:hypothetical protein
MAFLWNAEEGIQPWLDLMVKEAAKAAAKAAADLDGDAAGTGDGAAGGSGGAAAAVSNGSSFWPLRSYNDAKGGERFMRAAYYRLFRSLPLPRAVLCRQVLSMHGDGSTTLMGLLLHSE